MFQRNLFSPLRRRSTCYTPLNISKNICRFGEFCLNLSEKETTCMTIIPATPAHAADIAQLIMTAMTEDCCQYLAGKEHTLDDFYHMMLDLVLMDDSQYSWRNAFVAVDEEATEGNVEYAPVAGAIVGYDGADLHRLRRRFQKEALKQLQMDYSHMDDETEAGEFYLDSLAIYPEYRRAHSTPTAETCHRARRKPQSACSVARR